MFIDVYSCFSVITTVDSCLPMFILACLPMLTLVSQARPFLGEIVPNIELCQAPEILVRLSDVRMSSVSYEYNY